MKEMICEKCGKAFFGNHCTQIGASATVDELAWLRHASENNCIDSKVIKCPQGHKVAEFSEEFIQRFPLSTELLTLKAKAQHKCATANCQHKRYFLSSEKENNGIFDAARISITEDKKLFVRFGWQENPGFVIAMTDAITRVTITHDPWQVNDRELERAFEYAELLILGEDEIAMELFPDLDR